jgi:RimJ/RimL family protein N-acetyltransferase
LNQPRLSGDGVVLRAFSDADVDVVVDAGRDPRIPAITTVRAGGDRRDALIYIANQRSRAASGTGWSYAITDAATDRAVGQIGMFRRDIADGRVVIGYWVAPSARGRRYAERALKVLTAFGTTMPEITRIELYVEPFNEASWRSAQAAGFQREGLLGRWQIINGRPRDMYMYSWLPPRS